MSSNVNDEAFVEERERNQSEQLCTREVLVEDGAKRDWKSCIDAKYVLKNYGCAKIMQLAASGICSVCVLAVTKQDEGKVMDLPMHWRLEVLAMVTIASVVFSLLFFTVHFFKLTYQFPFEFYKVDLFISSVFFLAFGVLSVLVLEVALYYEKHYPDWHSIQAHESSIITIFAAISYGFGVFALFRQIRGTRQFRNRMLYNEHDGDTPVPIVHFDGVIVSYEYTLPDWVTTPNDTSTTTTTTEVSSATPGGEAQKTSSG